MIPEPLHILSLVGATAILSLLTTRKETLTKTRHPAGFPTRSTAAQP
jgi:hypothetical protein